MRQIQACVNECVGEHFDIAFLDFMNLKILIYRVNMDNINKPFGPFFLSEIIPVRIALSFYDKGYGPPAA